MKGAGVRATCLIDVGGCVGWDSRSGYLDSGVNIWDGV